MTSAVKDPRSLTKEKLKSELTNHNVTLPPSDSKKEIYVDLYRQHVLGPNSMKTKLTSDRAYLEALSSDEDDAYDSSDDQKKMMNGDTDPITADQVDSLTDDELYMALARRGVTVGPIVDSTRSVYQKKLKRILGEESDAQIRYNTNGRHHDYDENGHDDEFSDQDDEEPMETDIIPPYTTTVPDSTSQRYSVNQTSETHRHTTVTRRPADNAVTKTTVAKDRVPPPNDDRPIITQRSAHRTRASATTSNDTKTTHREEIVTQVNEVSEQTLASIQSQRRQLEQRRGISVWVQVCIIAVCAVIVFIVLSNMEPAYKNPALSEETAGAA